MRRSNLFLSASAVLVATGLTAATSGQEMRRGYPYESGHELYEHVCQGCHMSDGKGAIGAGSYPALAVNRRLQTALYPALIILKGQKAMPSFSELDDAQVAAVTNYIRSHFGNRFPDAITIGQVRALRPSAVSSELQDR